MTKSRPVILTCAITGAIHTPSMSDALPVTSEQIAASAIAAARAGASILHLHARDDADGRPVQTPEAFAPILKAIRAQCDCIINITTGGAPTMSVEDRLRPAATVQPELASLNMGSMNFGLYPMLDRYPDLQHDWERDYLSNRNIIFNNTFGQIEDIITTLSAHDTRFEFECYDTAHLYNLRHFLDRGLVKPPLFIQTVFGLMGGIGAHPDDVAHMKRTADRLFGYNWQWSVLGAGRHQMPLAAMALALMSCESSNRTSAYAETDSYGDYRKYFRALEYYKEREYKMAFPLFQGLAKKDVTKSQLILGGMYEQGLGIRRDYDKARSLYRRAAEQGLAEAKVQLAELYLDGQGVPVQPNKAQDLLEQAERKADLIINNLPTEGRKCDYDGKTRQFTAKHFVDLRNALRDTINWQAFNKVSTSQKFIRL